VLFGDAVLYVWRQSFLPGVLIVAHQKIYTKGERVLRIEAMAHNTEQLDCGRSLEKFPEIVSRLKNILERVVNALSCIDQCFIAEETLEQLPAPAQGQDQGERDRLQQDANALGSPSRVGALPFPRRVHRFPVGRTSAKAEAAEPIPVPAPSCLRS
jgi:hypothetical protein